MLHRCSSAPAPSFGLTRVAAHGAHIAGCPLFPADNAWRKDISHAPLNRHSAAWVRSIGRSVHVHPDFGSNPSYGIPYEVVPADQKKVPIRFTAYGDESDKGPYPIPLNARVEAGSDRHVLVASHNCHLYELYGAHRTAHGWAAASGAVFNLKLEPPAAGGLDVGRRGRAADPARARAPGRDQGRAHRPRAALHRRAHPARLHHRPGTRPARPNSHDVPPMGARFRLKASFSLKHYHGAALVVLRCLKKYGMFVADNGGNWFISGATYRGWNDDDLNQLKRVRRLGLRGRRTPARCTAAR